MRFTGWIPTATCRLSFSHAGSRSGDHKASTYNSLGQGGDFCAFIECRKSYDGSILTLSQSRKPRLFYIATGKTKPGKLPRPNMASLVPDFVDDEKAILHGEVVIFLDKPESFGIHKIIRQKIVDVSRRIKNFNELRLSVPIRDQLYEKQIKKIIRVLEGTRSREDFSAAYVKCQYELSRTGECSIWVREEDAKHVSDGYKDEFKNFFCGKIANYAFIFLKDLVHKHYHHNSRSDKKTIVYPSDCDDDLWRRQTNYSLVRMALDSRRNGEILPYKESLGILAYVESFQGHLASWRFEVDETTGARTSQIERKDYVPTDLTAFRASVDAKLRVLEWDAQRTLQVLALFFAFTFGTATIVSRAIPFVADNYDLAKIEEIYDPAFKFMSLHPLLSIFLPSMLLTIFVTTVFALKNLPILDFCRSHIKRFYYMFLGSVTKRLKTTFRGYVATLVLQAILLMIFVIVLFIFLWSYAQRL